MLMARVQHPPLTDARMRTLAAGATPIETRDGETRGLIVTVLPSGRKQFAVRYRRAGKQKRLLLGEYPAVSLAVARKRARKAQSAIDNGEDPARDRQAAKAAPTDTVKALAEDYLKKHARKFKRSADEDERLLDVDVLPKWGERSVRDLTRRDVRALVDGVVDRGAPDPGESGARPRAEDAQLRRGPRLDRGQPGGAHHQTHARSLAGTRAHRRRDPAALARARALPYDR